MYNQFNVLTLYIKTHTYTHIYIYYIEYCLIVFFDYQLGYCLVTRSSRPNDQFWIGKLRFEVIPSPPSAHNIAMNMAIYSWFTYQTWGFSIATLVYQRVNHSALFSATQKWIDRNSAPESIVAWYILRWPGRDIWPWADLPAECGCHLHEAPMVSG